MRVSNSVEVHQPGAHAESRTDACDSVCAEPNEMDYAETSQELDEAALIERPPQETATRPLRTMADAED